MSPRKVALYVLNVVALTVGLTSFSLVPLLAQSGERVSLIYPATGLGVALLWGYGPRWFPAVLISQFLLSYRVSNSFWIALFVAAVELLVITLFCWTMEKLRVSREFVRIRDLWYFLGLSAAATLIGGVASFIGEALTLNYPARVIAIDATSFWLSDFTSILIFAPLVFSWRRWPFDSAVGFRSWLFFSLSLIAIGTAIALIGEEAHAALFLLLPIVVFTAITSGLAGAASSGAILLFILVGLESPPNAAALDGVIRLVFIGTATATAYILAVVWREREVGARALIRIAKHDALTGMFNRHELERRLARLITTSPSSTNALLYLDLDQFKLVNDTCGHMAGDRMLQEVALELQGAAPDDVILARLGGDEFGCVLLNSSNDSASAVAARLHDAIDRYRFRFGSMTFPIGVSIGITFFPADDGDTADAVLGRADIACYVAKEDGRHRSHVYLPRDEAMLKWHSAIQEISQLEIAMENGSLQLYSQPIIDLAQGDETSFHEVLLRFVHDGSVRETGDFLPLAQRFGLMDRIDRWVIENSCRFIAQSGDARMRLSVNVSGSTLNDPTFYELVSALPDRFGINPQQICLEVTEGVMIHRLRQAVDSMKRLRAIGFDLALDDFGAGVASFAYLQELPVTHVKIDGRIISELRRDAASEVIVGSLVRLARLRSIECIAEWVEDEATLERVRALGVRYAQGFHIERPAPLSQLVSSPAPAGTIAKLA